MALYEIFTHSDFSVCFLSYRVIDHQLVVVVQICIKTSKEVGWCLKCICCNNNAMSVTTYLEHYSNFAKVSIDASFLAGIIMVSAGKEQTLNPKTINKYNYIIH